MSAVTSPQSGPGARVDFSAGSCWIDDLILAGPDAEVCLELGPALDRKTLRGLVAARQAQLAALGLRPGGAAALWLPPSLTYVVNLLACWRIGAQVAVLDYRLTQREADRALDLIKPQLLVHAGSSRQAALRALFTAPEITTPYHGLPARSQHALIQLSSGSTGPSKMIGRTVHDLVAELNRYTGIEGFPEPGQRVVVLASIAHVLGLVGGLLYSLYAGVRMTVPERLTLESIYRTVGAGQEPTTLLGVPSQAAVLAGVAQPPRLSPLARMVTGGEPVAPHVWQGFTDRYGVPLGNMYGMTEVGVIATDLAGDLRPALRLAPQMKARSADGELVLRVPASPYVGLVDETRWGDGWLHTRDAGTVDASAGLIRVLGRLDSQVSVGGLKVDLTEVEHTLAATPGVTEAVVVFDRGIRAYVASAGGVQAEDIERALAGRLAGYKRPRALYLLPRVPRTVTGKLLRDPAELRAAARQPVPPA